MVIVGLVSALIWHWHNKVLKRRVQAARKRMSSSYSGKHQALTDLCTQTTKSCEAPAGSHPCCVDHLATMLEALTDKLGPKIFIMFGTLLAWKRYGGKHMIPWDNDLDTGILAEHEILLKKAIPSLEKQGFTIKLSGTRDQKWGEDPGCRGQDACPKIKFPPARYYVMRYSKVNDLHIDIAILVSSSLHDGTPVLVDAPKAWAMTVPKMSPEETRLYKTWIFPRENILPVQHGKYLGIDVYVPAQPESLLTGMYGLNYMIPHNRDQYSRFSQKPVERLCRKLVGDNEDIGLAPTLIVNLDYDKERLHHLLMQCKEEGIYAERCGNCCARSLTMAEKKRFVRNDMHSWLHYLRPAQKKCFLSHEMCWKKAAKQNLPTLILEDDASFPFGVKKYLKTITDSLDALIKSGVLPKATTVRLGLGERPKLLRFGDTCFSRTKNLCTGAWAYIVTPDAAKELLKVSSQDNLSWPTDHFLNPPMDRSSLTRRGARSSGENRLPGPETYMFLELYYPIFMDIKQRYDLNVDKNRFLLIHELSSEISESRSSKGRPIVAPQYSSQVHNEKMFASLDNCFKRYGTDKSSKYNGYTSVYSSLLGSFRETPISLCEIGIGTMTNGPSNMNGYGDTQIYMPGASLRAWRDFFVNAKLILGVDIARDCMFREGNIETMLASSLDRKQVSEGLTAMGNPRFDVIIDDGLHTVDANTKTFFNFEPYIKNSGVYIIEDLTKENAKMVASNIRNGVGSRYLLRITEKEETNGPHMIIIRKR